MNRIWIVALAPLLATSYAQAQNFSSPVTAPSFSTAPPSVVADGTTDIAPALNAALGNRPVTLAWGPGSVYYRAASTILIPYGSALDGVDMQPGAPPVGIQIVCDANVNPCVQVGQGGGNGTASLSNVTISRAGGAPPAGTVGIKVLDGFNPRLTNVMSWNHAQCYVWQSHPSIGAGIASSAQNLNSGRCSDAHMVWDGWPEIHLIGGRFGVNGSLDYTANTYVRVMCSTGCAGAGSPNTYLIQGTQFNQGGNPTAHFMEFVSLTGPGPFDTGEVRMTTSHVENVSSALFTSDATWTVIPRINLSNVGFNTPGAAAFSFDPATQLAQWDLSGVQWFVANFNLAMATNVNLNAFNMRGGFVGGSAQITGVNGVAQFSNVTWASDLIYDGGWVGLVSIGDSVSGTFIDAGFGNVTVFNPYETRIAGSTAASCSSGVGPTTFRSVNGIVTHC